MEQVCSNHNLNTPFPSYRVQPRGLFKCSGFLPVFERDFGDGFPTSERSPPLVTNYFRMLPFPFHNIFQQNGQSPRAIPCRSPGQQIRHVTTQSHPSFPGLRTVGSLCRFVCTSVELLEKLGRHGRNVFSLSLPIQSTKTSAIADQHICRRGQTERQHKCWIHEKVLRCFLVAVHVRRRSW